MRVSYYIVSYYSSLICEICTTPYFETGWTDSKHYNTGCSKDWISLRLANKNNKVATCGEREKEDTILKGEATDNRSDGFEVKGKNIVASPVGNGIVYVFATAAFTDLMNSAII